MKAVILAGGFATRLWPLTEHTAKPLLKLAGKPIISHLLAKLPREIPVIVSTNAVFGKAFYEWRQQFRDRDIRVFIEDSSGETAKKGALAAVALVIEEFAITEDLLVLAGDNLFFFDFTAFLAANDGAPLLAALDIGDREAAKRFGVVVPGPHQTVQAFQEKPAEPQSTLISTGCLLFPARLLPELMAFSRRKNDDLGGIFEHFLQIGERVDYFPFHEKWFDIGSFSAYLEAQKYLIGERVLNDGAVLKGKVECSGTVYLGPGAVIENAVLADAIIAGGSQVRDACIRNAVLAENTTVRGVDLSGVSLRAESFVAAE